MSIVASNLTNAILSYSKNFVMDSNGILYCCFCSQVNSKPQIFIYKSEDMGNTWSDMNFSQLIGYYQAYPSITIDKNDKLHIFWQGYDSTNTTYAQIKYSNNVNGSWSNPINIQTISGYDQCNPSIAIDSNNKIHVTWIGYDSINKTYAQIKYSNNTSGSWSTWINISVVSGYLQQQPSIVIDSNNKCHIVWYGTDSNNISGKSQIKYSSNISGSWSNWINIQTISGYEQSTPNIAIDSNNKLHIIWCGTDASNPTYYQIKYSNNITGIWSSWINIQTISGYYQMYPSIVIDSNNKIHITWHGKDSNNPTYYQIKYSNNITGIWSTWINKTNGNVNYQCPFCIYKNNNLYCIYKTNTSIEFFNIVFIINKYLIQDGNRIKTTIDGINLIDLGTEYNESIFNQYGLNNLNLLNLEVLDKVINNEYKILMYKK